MEANKHWQSGYASYLYIADNQICLQPFIYQINLLLDDLNKSLVIIFQSSQNALWEREKVGLQLTAACY